MDYYDDIKKRREKKLAELTKNRKFNYKDRYQTSDFEANFKRKFIFKIFISFILFIFVIFIFQLNHPYAQMSQQFVKEALTRDYNFKGFYSLYQEKFTGNPGILPTFEIIEKDKVVKLSSPINKPPLAIKEMEQGIYIETETKVQAIAMDKGVVTSVGEKENLGKVIKIMHQNGIEGTYALLYETTVKKDDWVEKGFPIGIVNERLYISISSKGEYLNPLEVIVFD